MRIICIGAHPDDCEIKFGGTAFKLARSGNAIQFVSVTNGGAGHQSKQGAELTALRREELSRAGQRLGIACSEVLGAPDGALQPELSWRCEIIRRIRRWEADVVVSHRPWDYHPDHRYTGQLVQDAAYLVQVPAICPDTSALHHNPVFLYMEDTFATPSPFEPHIAVDIDDVWCDKIYAMDAHFSQFYEWLPWLDGKIADVPRDEKARRSWLSEEWSRPVSKAVRDALVARYGSPGQAAKHAEAFQVCEYGRQPSAQELDEILSR